MYKGPKTAVVPAHVFPLKGPGLHTAKYTIAVICSTSTRR